MRVDQKFRLGCQEALTTLQKLCIPSSSRYGDLLGSIHVPGTVTLVLTQYSPDGESPDFLSGFQGCSDWLLCHCLGLGGTAPREQDPEKSQVGTGESCGQQQPSEVRGGLGGITKEPRRYEGCSVLREGLACCGPPPAISHHPEGDRRCKWAITFIPHHRNSTWAPTYGHHPAWAASCSSPLSSLPTMTHWGPEITGLYLRHHFHIICL